ncbi:polar amino acid transport system substrate-binding protein [Azospirillum agricola]|uniref:transporter substrate-binding domain-containing protein n=1 Tax=Azospirillum agricola TaxID=1720247 RepID=UPI001AEB74CF|nr:transporter substrate-binding domain-containing protein [Azospirillum agricola]MBP2229572.1 polar amino acid transport system substrate-binding protein [Azospirillum agricola]
MRIKTLLSTATAAVAALWLAAAPVTAQADQLDDIMKAKKIRIAVAMGIPLFAFVDKDVKATGSDVETARLLAKDMGVELELVEITNAARVPTIQTRKADLLIATLAITPERKKVVDFTIPYATLDIIVAGTQDNAIKGYDDLNGKKIGLTRATVNDSMVTKGAKGAEVVRFEDDATLITAAVSGQLDIVSTQTAVLAAMNEKRPQSPLKVKFVQQELNLGIALPQGEDRLKEWVNNWIKTNFQNGKMNAIFSAFHDRDLPQDLLTRQ